MKIIVGLGNIGNKYAKTRHNCGFIMLDRFVEEVEKEGLKVSWKEDSKLKAITSKIPYNNEILFLAKPTTLMNNSGQSVNKIINFFKEPIENLIVVYDDIDLPLGSVRIREKGGPGTHNGMKSIINALGSENFKRIRIGIESRGELAPKHQDITSFVLSDFTEKEIPILKKSLDIAVEELKNNLT
ncbi:aminoacyl-tRNA hydrolase [Candidatus Peregrinibacteria bacterium]|nr:aminoacyl-tRNA hydrolase [Candidatus Peregrinibacteria bacterium]